MLQTETIHRYSRVTTWMVELVCTLAVALAALNASARLLLFVWQHIRLDRALFGKLPFLPSLVSWVERWSGRVTIDSLTDLLPALGWLAFALLLAVLLRNAFPVIRTSSRGMLIEFASGWLPITWESIKAIKVTEDLASERFVLLTQTDTRGLTGWHRCYSLLYNFGMRRGFLITSSISGFDKLVQEILNETSRAARAGDGKAVKLEEGAWSPLFRFLLSPGSFFSRRALSDTGVEAERTVSPQAAMQMEVVRGSYPSRITILFVWGTALLALVAIWQYLLHWAKFLALVAPDLRRFWPFSSLTLTTTEAAYPWMQLVAAHLMAVLVLLVLMALRNLLPAIEARTEGLRVRSFGRWLRVPWTDIAAIKVTELSEQSQIVLLQTRGRHLPGSFRASSLLYDAGFTPGVLMTSAISNFEPLLQRILVSVSQAQQVNLQELDEDADPLLQQNAPSWALWLAFRPSMAIDRLVEQARENDDTKQFSWRMLLKAAGPALLLALPVALLPLFSTLLSRALPPDAGLLLRIVLLLVLGLLEWLLIGLLAPTLDEMTGGGEEGQRPLYLYPVVQLPRVLAMIGALLLLALGVPVLPVIVWIGAIVWSFILAAGLWEGLYGWKGSQLLLGGLIPVFYQMLVLLIFLLTQR